MGGFAHILWCTFYVNHPPEIYFRTPPYIHLFWTSFFGHIYSWLCWVEQFFNWHMFFKSMFVLYVHKNSIYIPLKNQYVHYWEASVHHCLYVWTLWVYTNILVCTTLAWCTVCIYIMWPLAVRPVYTIAYTYVHCECTQIY